LLADLEESEKQSSAPVIALGRKNFAEKVAANEGRLNPTDRQENALTGERVKHLRAKRASNLLSELQKKEKSRGRDQERGALTSIS